MGGARNRGGGGGSSGGSMNQRSHWLCKLCTHGLHLRLRGAELALLAIRRHSGWRYSLQQAFDAMSVCADQPANHWMGWGTPCS